MEGKHLKPGAIAKTLGVSTATVRNYVHEFQKFLSPAATSDTNRRFTEKDVQVLRLVRSMLNEGESYEQVRQYLETLPLEGDVFEGDVFEGFEQEQPFQEVPSAIQPLEFFTKFVEQLTEEHKSTIQAKDETIENLKADKERLQEEIDWLRLPWFIRWFRKPGS